MRKIDLETFWGGIFATIAIVATIVEACYNGWDGATVAGVIKDISGVLVVVMVLIVAIKSLIPKRQTLSLNERVVKALDEWQDSNSTMIVKSTDDEKTGKYGFSLRTDVRDFYREVPQSKNVGWFVRLPLPEGSAYEQTPITMLFHLNKGTFFEGVSLSADELKSNFDQLNNLFCGFINAKYGGVCSASGQNDRITVQFKQPLDGEDSDEAIEKMIEVINGMYQAYLASANVKAV